MFVEGITSDHVTKQCRDIPTWLLSPGTNLVRGFLQSLTFVDSLRIEEDLLIGVKKPLVLIRQ